MSLDYRPVLVATAIRVVGFVTIAAFGKVRRVIFALDRRIDALAQTSRFRNLVIQVSERVSKRRLQRVHKRPRELRVQWVLHSLIKSTREATRAFGPAHGAPSDERGGSRALMLLRFRSDSYQAFSSEGLGA
jgi:hypothetical protein